MKKILWIFFKNLFKTLGLFLIIVGVGVGSYYVSLNYLKKDITSDEDLSKAELEDMISQATVDKVARNLVYVVNDSGRVVDLYIIVCNTEVNNIDYITIPVQTVYTIPSSMYQKLTQVSDQVPQIVKVAKLYKCFQNTEDPYGYATLVVQRMLGQKMSYYTVISQDKFKSRFFKNKVKVKYTPPTAAAGPTQSPGVPTDVSSHADKVPDKVPLILCKQEYLDQLESYGDDQQKIADYIKDDYKTLTSNLTVYSKIGYVETFAKIDPENFHYWVIPGQFVNAKEYQSDTDTLKKFIQKIMDNDEQYTSAQYTNLSTGEAVIVEAPSESKKKEKSSAKNKKRRSGTAGSESSKGKKILVLNGSKIAGLAAKTKEKLEDDGFTVSGTGDYEDEVLINTRIIVSSEKQGGDLKKYFKNPQIVTGKVRSGCDIEIILGTRDAND